MGLGLATYLSRQVTTLLQGQFVDILTLPFYAMALKTTEVPAKGLAAGMNISSEKHNDQNERPNGFEGKIRFAFISCLCQLINV
jgi:hypothetical protein